VHHANGVVWEAVSPDALPSTVAMRIGTFTLISAPPQKVPSLPGSHDADNTPYVMPTSAPPKVSVLARKNCHGATSRCANTLAP